MNVQSKWMVPVVAALAWGISLAAPLDFAQFGYPNVVATLTLNPQERARLELGGAMLSIPREAFGKDPVKLEVLQGNATTWQTQAPAGQKVLYAFALRVTNLKTGEVISTFKRPLEFSLNSRQISNTAQLLTTSAANPAKVEAQTSKPKIREYTFAKKFNTGVLSHPLLNSDVGWLVTVPNKS